jgi:hypothetical protein
MPCNKRRLLQDRKKLSYRVFSVTQSGRLVCEDFGYSRHGLEAAERFTHILRFNGRRCVTGIVRSCCILERGMVLRGVLQGYESSVVIVGVLVVP